MGVRLLALAIVAVCAAGLTTRLAPDVWRVAPSAATDRLSYPLTYWNGFGVLAAIGLVLLVQLASAVREPRAVRVLAAAATPIVVATIFYTFSRGAIAAGAVGIVVLLVVARPIGAPPGWPRSCPPAPACCSWRWAPTCSPRTRSTRPRGSTRVTGWRSSSRSACCSPAAASGAARRRRAARRAPVGAVPAPDRARLGPGGRRARDRGGGRGGPGFAHRQYDRFVSGDVTPETDQRARLLNPGNNGRLDHWRVALSGPSRPLHGDGAGTYSNLWDRDRPQAFDVQDGHSLYLESSASSGSSGCSCSSSGSGRCSGARAAASAAARSRRRRPPARGDTSCGPCGPGIDWDWEMPAYGLGVHRRRRAARAPSGSPAACGRRQLARLPMGPACSCCSHAGRRHAVAGARSTSIRDFRAGDCRRAINSALERERDAPVRPQPFLVIGFCDVRIGRRSSASWRCRPRSRATPTTGLPLRPRADEGRLGQDPRPDVAPGARDEPALAAHPRRAGAFDCSDPAVWKQRSVPPRCPSELTISRRTVLGGEVAVPCTRNPL